MAISDTQKVDLLYKKVGYGVAKTDVATSKSPSNEANASPLLSPGKTIWQQDSLIASVSSLPSSNSSVVTVYRDSLSSTVQCTKDTTVGIANETWDTNLTDWIPVQYGSGYQVSLYAAPSGTVNPQTAGKLLPPDGSGNNDGWYFDYQAGIVNFSDTNVPTYVSGNVIYVVGARYTGTKGISSFPGGLVIGNANISGNTISVANVYATLYGNVRTDYITPNLSNVVTVSTNSALGLPVGPTGARPAAPFSGLIRYNSDNSTIEFYNGSSWQSLTNTIYSQSINGDGVNTSYSLNYSTTTNGVLVSINGTLQQAGIAYTVSGSTITFVEIPQATDIIDIRFLTTASATASVNSLIVNPGNILVTTVNTVIDSWSNSTYRSAYYTISSTTAVDAHLATVFVVQSGSKVSVTTQPNVNTGVNTITYYANINAGTINILANGTTQSNIRVQQTYFIV
jgi:hypothetical protein